MVDILLDPDHPRSFGVVLVTVASEAEGHRIAETLLAEQLAACVSLFPIQSLYIWKSQLCHESEWQLVIKTDLKEFRSLERRIQALHSYEVPEIIALPIVAGSQGYLSWLGAQVQKSLE